MFDPPEALHRSFERALAKVRAGLGRDYPMLIGGKERFLAEKFEDGSGALGREFEKFTRWIDAEIVECEMKTALDVRC